MIASLMTAPRRVMRAASHCGTRPPCSGRSALPALRGIFITSAVVILIVARLQRKQHPVCCAFARAIAYPMTKPRELDIVCSWALGGRMGMDRREFIAALASAVVASPPAHAQQQGRIP